MTQRSSARVSVAAVLVTTILFPVIGAAMAGRDLRPVFQFPPELSIPHNHPAFSWIAVSLVTAPFVVLAIAWAKSSSRGFVDGPVTSPANHVKPTALQLPWWGWTSFGWTIAWWIIAWTRFPWFDSVQRYTFFPLWFGFIGTVSAFTYSRKRTCGLTRKPRRWIGLFVTSAVFWWLFEWLNRFTHNWHYLNVADFGATTYAAHASLCFSTVLPAVSAVAEFITKNDRWQASFSRGPRLTWLGQKPAGLALIIAGAIGLIGAGALPMYFYPALWAAPLALLVGCEILTRDRGIVHDVAAGNWRSAATWAIAALVCGFFWEMWNIRSAAKWIYTVPFVDRWHVFEMPLLGYLGYLPFGLECYFVSARVLGTEPPFSNVSST